MLSVLLGHLSLLVELSALAGVKTCMMHHLPIHSLKCDVALSYTPPGAAAPAAVFFLDRDETTGLSDIVAMSCDKERMDAHWHDCRASVFALPKTYCAFNTDEEWKLFYKGAAWQIEDDHTSF